MPSIVPNGGKVKWVDGSFVWGTTALGCMLVTAYGGIEDVDHEFISDVLATAAAELAGTGYARVTAGFTGEAVTQDDTNDRADIELAKVTFNSLAGDNATPSHALLYDNSAGTDATRTVLAAIVLTTPPAPDGNNYEIRWSGVDGTGDVIRVS